QALIGTHDFSSFETAGSERPSTIRTFHVLNVYRRGAENREQVKLSVLGDGFLYNMVRTIVGTLIEVGTGKRDVTWPAEVLASCDRRKAGQTAPPQGLFLARVYYSPFQPRHRL